MKIHEPFLWITGLDWILLFSFFLLQPDQRQMECQATCISLVQYCRERPICSKCNILWCLGRAIYKLGLGNNRMFRTLQIHEALNWIWRYWEPSPLFNVQFLIEEHQGHYLVRPNDLKTGWAAGLKPLKSENWTMPYLAIVIWQSNFHIMLEDTQFYPVRIIYYARRLQHLPKSARV